MPYGLKPGTGHASGRSEIMQLQFGRWDQSLRVAETRWRDAYVQLHKQSPLLVTSGIRILNEMACVSQTWRTQPTQMDLGVSRER